MNRSYPVLLMLTADEAGLLCDYFDEASGRDDFGIFKPTMIADEPLGEPYVHMPRLPEFRQLLVKVSDQLHLVIPPKARTTNADDDPVLALAPVCDTCEELFIQLAEQADERLWGPDLATIFCEACAVNIRHQLRIATGG